MIAFFDENVNMIVFIIYTQHKYAGKLYAKFEASHLYIIRNSVTQGIAKTH